MTKDEALNIAIDYMNERLEEHDAKFQRHPVAEAERNNILADIEAVKEALAQTEQEQLMSDQINYGMSVTQGGKRIDPMSIYKEPEQSTECGEPVAWMDDYNACKCPDNEARCFSDKVFRMMQKHTDSLVKRQEPVAKVCHDLDGHIGWNPNLKQLPNEGTPLYTTPPQRKPLTDEEIGAILDDPNIAEKHQGNWLVLPYSYARAIEAAHGIKGEA